MLNNKKRNSCCLLLVILLTVLLLPGCWGFRETDQLGYILSMGIDKGKENIVEITFTVAIPQAPGGGDKEKSTVVISLEAASIFGALQMADSFMSRDMTFIHNNMIVVSEEIAKEGLSKYINPLVRSREIRRNSYVMITKGKAKDFLEKNVTVIEKYPSRQIGMLMENKKHVGFIPVADIDTFYDGATSPGREPVVTLVGVNQGREGEEKDKSFAEKVRTELAYSAGELPRSGANKIDVIGTAVFRRDKLVGFLNGSETRYYQMINGKYGSAIFTFPDPETSEGYIVVVRIKQAAVPQVKMDITGDVPQIGVDLTLEGEIMSIQSGINYESQEKQEEFKQYLENYIATEINSVVEKAQNEFKSDIFGLGDYTRKYFWTWQAWNDYNWLERFPQAEIEVRPHLYIRRTGLLINTTPLSK